MLHLLVFLLNCFLLLYAVKRLSVYHPLKIWMVFQTLFYTGTFYITNFRDSIEVDHFYLYTLFVFIASVASLVIRSRKIAFKVCISKGDVSYVYKLFYISIILSVTYYALAGANLFIKSLMSLFATGGGLENVDSQRFAFYAGEEYYAPGFFNLFKNLLLPASFFSVFLFHLKKYEVRSRLFIGMAFLLFFVLILGTGQRGAMILSLVFGFVVSYYFLGREKTIKYFLSIGSIFLLLFLLSTFFLRRNAVDKIESIGDVITVGESALDRFFVVNQTAGLDGYKYIIKYENIQWGMDWINNLEQFLPGKSQNTNFANKVFYERYGTFRGTSPPTLMVSVYYNFGLIGVVLFPLVLVFIFNRLYLWAVANYRSYKDLFIYLFLYFSLGTWATSGIDYPIRNGLIIFSVLFLLRNIAIVKRRKSFGLHSSYI